MAQILHDCKSIFINEILYEIVLSTFTIKMQQLNWCHPDYVDNTTDFIKIFIANKDKT